MNAWAWGLGIALGGAIGASAMSCGSNDTTTGGGAGTAGGDGGVRIILDGGGEVAKPPDGEKACPQTPCNYQTNAGCSATTSCEPTLGGTGSIVPSCEPAGTGKTNDPCGADAGTASGDCAPGYFCLGKTCHKLCCGGDWSGCASPKEHCFRGIEFPGPDGGGVPTGAMVCDAIDQCSALSPSSCNELGMTCQIVDPTGAQACAPEGTGDQGEACPCKGGFYCVAKACRRLCKAVEGGGEPSCQAHEGDCVHFNRDPDGVGECSP